MKKILILGANGQIARLVIKRLLAKTEDHLTLYLKNSARVNDLACERVTIVDGDVNDLTKLKEAMKNKDIVYANLGGKFEPMVKNIVQAMTQNNVSRLIYVTGLGLYHEVPGEFGRWVEETIGYAVMEDTRRAARIIEESPLDYTILRAAYMNNDKEVNYQLTKKGEKYQGTIISRASIADLIVKMVKNPNLYSHSSLGISKPGTDSDRPML